ncbi:MAG: hypothetical protein QXH91_09800, partial [Candidatus Bathyarchaeia archaeon]
MRVKAVLFDLFETLLLIKSSEAFYENCLKKVYEFLKVNSGISFSFDDFKYAYFEVRKSLYEGVNKGLEEPHFSIRISQTLQRLGYNHGSSDPLVNGATN